MLKKINEIVSGWQDTFPWTNVYGIARSLIALSSMLTLLFNPAETIFKPSSISNDFPICGIGYSAFCLGQGDYTELNIIRWICIVLLFLVVTGWRPRFTGIIHWYISYSMNLSLIVTDGGEAVASVITFLLIPITLTDPRKWHWDVSDKYLNQNIYSKIIAYLSYFFIRVQVAIIYFHSTIAKLGNKEWIDGTAVYYYSLNKIVGFNSFFETFTHYIVSSPLIVIPTWGTLIVQTIIFCSLFAPSKYWKNIFIMAILMHEVFALMLGLISFSLIMMGALVLYLTPFDKKLGVLYFKRRSIPNIKKNQEAIT